ncbi:MAG TPA: glycosyltransferase family 4 protein [Candidatus Polarisedimenticolia bacterium]|nr:glycosyltransferase family 4 protein [Candidatus Polarisedimenticolia bacterium]
MVNPAPSAVPGMNPPSERASPDSLPRLCFIGPLMAERHSGYVVTQGVVLSGRFRSAGYPVVTASASPNRYLRLLDVARTIVQRRGAIDILIVHVYSGPSFVVEDVASWLGRRFGLRIILLLHGGAMPEFMAKFPDWTRRVLGRADAIVAPSPFLARSAAAHGFECQVIPNLIDLNRYPHRRRGTLEPRLFWMRSFHPVYNPILAVRVLERLRATHPRATLVMGGPDKGMQSEVQALARRIGLGDAVRFPGFLDMAGKAREGQAADVFINTSRVDNMPVCVVEAAAMGIPVVSTAVGGVTDLVQDGETALLVPDDDVEAMAGSIQRLLRDPDLAGRLSEKGRRLAERSAWEQVHPLWEALFARLQSHPSPTPRRGTDVRH